MLSYVQLSVREILRVLTKEAVKLSQATILFAFGRLVAKLVDFAAPEILSSSRKT